MADPPSALIHERSGWSTQLLVVRNRFHRGEPFVRNADILGANALNSALKPTLKATAIIEAGETLNRDRSRPFEKPMNGRMP